ncbi:GumC family protein [Dysgonomonas sp. ZJ279]|uniref:GumC family protein n=1 Tax=Dysgonomonas sp. ZJ279 TaxID=2709796 RepID=UPI0013EDE8C9|nr:tyrosine-protein kinase family protein [Dysgonomonas sp. ZJ279]
MNKFTTSPADKVLDETEEEINLREVFSKYFSHWKWFILSIIVFLIIGMFVYLCLDRKYEVQSAILLKQDKNSPSGGAAGAMASMADLGLFSSASNIDNEVAVLSSPNLMRQVVSDLGLHTSYFENGLFRNTEVYNKCPYIVHLEDISPDELKGKIYLKLEKEKNGIRIIGEYLVKKDEYEIDEFLDQLPGFITLPEGVGRLSISHRPDFIVEEGKENEAYRVHINNTQKEAYALGELLTIAPTSKSSSVLNLTITVQNVDKGVDILNKILKTYNKNNVDDNNEIARNTSVFVDERLVAISLDLKDIENKVVDYKTGNSITDLGEEAKLFIENTSEIEQRLIDLGTQLQLIDFIEDYLKKTENSYRTIPTLGISDGGLAGLISSYNSQVLLYESLERSTTESNPSRIKALSDINNLQASVLSAIVNQKKTLNISKKELEKRSSLISSRIRSVPNQERDLLDIKRQQQIKQSLYLYLMQVKEETNIAMASYSDKAKLITDPIIPDYPISPRGKVILLGFFILGIVLPIGIIYVRELMQVNIVSRKELEKLSKVSVIGEIMKADLHNEVIVVKPGQVTPIVELFRTLRNNMQFILGSTDTKTILVTSTVPGEGKTFVSINLAASFALLEKKVLLVGLDIRNPRLADDIGFSKKIGVTSYLSGGETEWKPLVNKLKGYGNLDILQAGVIPPNPNELLMKPILKKLLDEVKEEYDLVIIDSAPIGVVSDTFLLAPYADATVYVTRENVTPKEAVNFINEVYKDDKLPDMYLVLNGADLSKNKGRYGYGNTYGYGVDKQS